LIFHNGQVLDVIKSNIEDDTGPLSLNVIGRTDLSSSWVVEKPLGKRIITEANETESEVR
jgi:hypothetical protein